MSTDGQGNWTPPDGKVQAKFYVKADTRNKIKEYGALKGQSMSKVLEDLVADVIEPELKEMAPELPLGT